MEFGYTPAQISMQMESKKFALEEMAEHSQLFEVDLFLREKLFEKMAQKGFMTLSIPKKNRPKDSLSLMLAIKEISKVDAGIGIAMSVTNMVAEAIERYGSEPQKEKYFPLMRNGQCVPASFALTEKNAGSDPKHLLTTATLDAADENFFWINGAKQFITNGDISGVLIVFAKTFDTKKEGITAFLVDRETPGLQVSKIENKLGLLSLNLVSLTFDNCRVARSQMLGDTGQGLKVAFSSLDRGRMGVAAQAIGIAEAAYEKALAYSQTREQFGKALCENQAIAFKLADMHVKLSAAKLMLGQACWLCDQGRNVTLAAAEAKLYASEMANEIASEALQIHGGYGYTKDYPLEKYFRDARVTTLYEGTSEIQRIVISRQLLNLATQTETL
jgi:alkylation response protein AidB-like acyl-CoA dehydrogenase